MNIKTTLVISYRVLCVAVTLIEAADLGKTIYGKYKNNNKSVTPVMPADTTKVETVCD